MEDFSNAAKYMIRGVDQFDVSLTFQHSKNELNLNLDISVCSLKPVSQIKKQTLFFWKMELKSIGTSDFAVHAVSWMSMRYRPRRCLPVATDFAFCPRVRVISSQIKTWFKDFSCSDLVVSGEWKAHADRTVAGHSAGVHHRNGCPCLFSSHYSEIVWTSSS